MIDFATGTPLKTYVRFFIFLQLFVVASGASFAQNKSVVIGDLTTKPNAILILNPPDGNQGLLLPQVTTAKRVSMQPASPAEDGLVVFDMNDKAFYHWKEGLWIKGLGNGTVQNITYDATNQILTLSGGATVDLSLLKEIPNESGHAGEFLTTNGTNVSWATFSTLGDITAVNAGAGLSGSATSGDATLSVKTDNTTMSINGSNEIQLKDGAITLPKFAAGVPNTILTTNASGVVGWTPGAADEQNLSLGGNTLNITNGSSVNLNSLSAGGQLTGPLNNLALSGNTVTSATIVDGSIQTSDIADLSVTGIKIQDGTINSIKLNNTGVTAATYGSATQVGQFVVDGQGRVTSASSITITGALPLGPATGDLTGNYPAPTIAGSSGNNLVSAINNGATSGTITTNRLANAVVLDTEFVAAGDVTGTFVSGLQINVGAVSTADIAPFAIIDSKIAPGIGASKVSSSLTDGQVLTTIAGATVWANVPSLSLTGVIAGTYGSSTQTSQITIDNQGRITSAANTIITGTTPGGVATGDLTGTYPNPTIAASSGTSIANAINNSAGAGTISGSRIAPNFSSQNVTTAGNISTTGSGALSISGTSSLAGTVSIGGTTTIATLGGGINMVIAGPSGLLSTQPIPAPLTQGNLVSSLPALSVTGGANAVIGSGVSLSIQNATNLQAGLLTAADFNVFNNKVAVTSTPAAGDISGTFASGFQIAASSVGDIEISTMSTSKLSAGGALNGQFLAYNGSTWAPVTPSVDGTTIAGTGTLGSPFKIKEGSANQVLITNGSTNVQWVNQSTIGNAITMSGDVSGLITSNTVLKLRGFTVSAAAPADQQVLQYDQATTQWKPTTVASITPTAFKARQTTQQSVSGTVMIVWDDQVYDDGGDNFFSNAFHSPSAGLYHFDATISVLNLDKQDRIEIILRVGPTDIIRAYGNTGQDNDDVSASVSTDVKINAGDMITVWINIPATRNTTGSGIRTQFSGRKIY